MKNQQLHYSFLLMLLVTFASKSFSQSIDLSKPVGTTPVNVSGTATGGVSYVIPIDVLKGTNDMEPKINLVYNSQTIEGIAGFGWNLSAYSVISRQGKRLYYNGKSTPVYYRNLDDAFLLDGQRLFPLNGINGNNGIIYGTENEDFSKIESFGGDSFFGPERFKVTTREGMILDYGADVNSKVLTDNGQSVMFWLLKRVTDKSGNYLEYKYNINQIEVSFALIEISYTGNSNTGQLPYNKIEFTYDLLPNWQNRKIFEGGSVFSSPYLLNEIKIKNADNIVVKKYQCSYTLLKSHSFLSSFIETGSDGTSLNPLKFEYGSNITAPDVNISPSYPGFNANHTFTGELTGDGKQDIVAARYYIDNSNIPHYTGYDVIDGFTTYGGAAAMGFAYTYTIPQNTSLREIKGYSSGYKNFVNNDYDGDGKEDVLMVSSTISKGDRIFTGVKINYSRKYNSYSSTYETIDYPEIPYNYPYAFRFIKTDGSHFIQGDFDGDGAQDYILILGTASNGLYQAFLSSPAKKIINKEIAGFGVGGYPSNPFYASTIAFGSSITPIDFDGDGKMEILVQKSGISYILRITGMSAEVGYEYAAGVVYTFSDIALGDKVFPGDFNGDGKTDLLVRSSPNKPTAAWNILYSTGKEYKSYPFTFQNRPYLDGDNGGSAHHLMVADLNHDGKSDIWHSLDLTTSSSKHTVYYSNGVPLDNSNSLSAFSIYDYFSNTSINRSQTAQTVIGDFNFDGKPDIFSINGTSAKIIYPRPDKEENLMVKTRNGLGAETVFNYQKGYSRSGTYEYNNPSTPLGQGVNGNPYTVLNTPMYVLHTLAEQNGSLSYKSTYIEYEDAMYHPLRGFLGFKKVTSTDGSTGINSVSYSEMNPDFFIPYIYKTTTGQYGNLLTETNITNDFQRINPANNQDKRFLTKVSKINNFNHVTGAATETVNIHDEYGNITSSTARTGTFFGTAITNLERIVTNTTYVRSGTPVPCLPESSIIKKTRAGQLTVQKSNTYAYNPKGLLASVTEFSETAIASTTSYTYDNFGNILTENLSAPNTLTPFLTNSYDSKGRNLLSRSTSGSGITKSETYIYNSLNENVSSVKASDGLITTFDYDGFGNIVKTKLPDGNIIHSDLEWESAPGRYSITTYRFSDNGAWNKTYFDIIGKEIRKESKGFNDKLIFSTTQYNQQGQIYKQEQARYLTEPPVEITYIYDQLQRLSSVTNGVTTTSYSYNLATGGFYTTTIKDADGQSSSTTTDPSGKVVKTKDNGGQLDFTYDSWGNQKETKIGSLSLVLNSYDSYGRQISMTDKNAGTIHYEYDALGQLIKQTDAKNITHKIMYDAFGRIESKIGPEGTTSYTYYSEPGKSNDNLTSVSGFGGDTKSYFYDNLQRLKSESTIVDGQTFTQTYEYDVNGNLKNTTYPSGVKINTTYSIQGIPTQTSMTYNGVTKILFTANAMNSRGIYTSYSYGNGKSSTLTYDLLKNVPTRYFTAGIQDLNLVFNESTGNLSSRSEVIKGLTETFSYDNLNRLVGSKVNNVVQYTMTYDNSGGNSLGNIQSKSDIGNYRYDAQKINEVRFITSNSGVPTNLPNIVSVNTQSLTYTPFLKTATIDENGFQIAYTYGQNEQRIKSVLRQNGNLIETKYYLGNYEKQVKGPVSREIHYISAGNGLCAIIVKENGIATPYFVYSDHLGSPLTITNSAGAIVAEQNFDAWGRYRSPANWTYSSVPARPEWLYRGFTGHEHLMQFALINMNGRMYDPVTCRMLSPDNYVPLPWSTQGYNRFGYANNNPLIYTDPDGELFWLLIPIGIGAGLNIYDNWSHIEKAFKEGIWNGIGSTLAYAAVGATQGIVTTYLPPIAAGFVNNVLGTVGKGIINGDSFENIMIDVSRGAFLGIATGGFSGALGGTFNKAGRWVAGKISNKISNEVINQVFESFVADFGVQLAINTTIDALDDKNEFNIGKVVLRSFKSAAINSVRDGASGYAKELKQRQVARQATNTTRVIREPVVTSGETLPEYGMVNKPITNIPNRIPYQPYLSSEISVQTQRNINAINRLKRRSPTIIRNNDGRIFTIINYGPPSR